jgi:hypothetical protein
MMDMNQLAAAAMWDKATRAERQTILNALKADLALAANDYAGLAPELQAGIVAGMPVEAASSGEAPAEKADEGEIKPKRGR